MAGKLRATSIQRLHDIFDFSPETLSKRPDVPQRELERMPDAARGIPEHVKKIGTKRNLDRMDGYVEKGLRQNLLGNQQPLTADRHNLRALGYTDTRGKLL